MKLKRMITFVLTALLCVSSLVGCSTGSNSIGETTVSGGPDASEVLLTVGDEKVTVGEFRYYVLNAAVVKAYSVEPSAAEDMSGFDWNQKTKDGNTLSEEILESSLNSVLRETMMLNKAKENGVMLTEDEKKANNQMVDSYVLQNGEEAFLLSANAMAVASVKDYKNLANRMQAVEVAKDEVTSNLSAYMEVGIDFSSWKSDDTVTAQHVLIMSDSKTYPDPEATAQEVLARAKAGDDFAALIEEYNEDPGATEAGYTFGKGEMVKEFEEASFALDCGEISDVVKTEYGYHVIKRLAGLAELQNYWFKNMPYEINEKLLAEISVKDIVQAAYNAQKNLQEQNKSQTTESK